MNKIIKLIGLNLGILFFINNINTVPIRCTFTSDLKLKKLEAHIFRVQKKVNIFPAIEGASLSQTCSFDTNTNEDIKSIMLTLHDIDGSIHEVLVDDLDKIMRFNEGNPLQPNEYYQLDISLKGYEYAPVVHCWLNRK